MLQIEAISFDRLAWRFVHPFARCCVEFLPLICAESGATVVFDDGCIEFRYFADQVLVVRVGEQRHDQVLFLSQRTLCGNELSAIQK